MIKQIAWNTFKKTGNINTFLELKQLGEIENNIQNINSNILSEKINYNSNIERSIRGGKL